MKPHFNVLIATPANNFTPGYVKSLLKTIYVLDKENISWNFLNAGGSLVAMAREVTIAGESVDDPLVKLPQNGNFTYDKIIWIDSDISWEVEDFFALYNSKKDIISGCYLMEDRTVPIYNQPRGGMMPESMLLNKKDPFKIAGCGFGFIAIKSGIFENMSRPWFGPVSIKNTAADKDENPIFILVGEDLSWCTKAINAGFEIWVDPKVKVVHQKTQQLFWKENNVSF